MSAIKPNTFNIVVGILSLPLIYLIFTYCGDDDYWWVADSCEVTLILIGLAGAMKAVVKFGGQTVSETTQGIGSKELKRRRTHKRFASFEPVVINFVTVWSLVFAGTLIISSLILTFCSDAFQEESSLGFLLFTTIPSLVAGIGFALPSWPRSKGSHRSGKPGAATASTGPARSAGSRKERRASSGSRADGLHATESRAAAQLLADSEE